MSFDGWVVRRILVVIGLPLVVVAVLLLKDVTVGTLRVDEAQLGLILTVALIGLFFVSFRWSLCIDQGSVIRQWRLFWLFGGKIRYPSSEFEKVVLETAVSRMGYSADSGSGGSYRYYRLMLKHRANEQSDVFISNHLVLRRKEDVEKAVSTAEKLATYLGLPLVRSETVMEDVRSAS